MEYTEKQLKCLKKFEHVHILDKSFIKKSLSRLDCKGKSVGVLYSFEILAELNEMGLTDITLIDTDPLKATAAKIYGFRFVNSNDFLKGNMKFDLIIGNPPYKGGGFNSKWIYMEFFEKALDSADEVAIIMPTPDGTSIDGKVANHQKRVMKHKKYVSEAKDKLFIDVPIDLATPIRYGIYSKKINNHFVAPKKKDALDSYTPIMPERKRMEWVRGGWGGTIKSINKPHGQDPHITWDKEGNSKRKLSAPYLVCTNHMPIHDKWESSDRGRLSVVIHENTGQESLGPCVFAVQCQTLEEANKTKEWILSEEIKKELEWFVDNKSCAVSKTFLNMLPTYVE